MSGAEVSWSVIEGDALDVLRTLDAGSVQTCITSPPYFGLRDYGTGAWEGGDPDCDHQQDTGFNAGFNERWGQGRGERKQEERGKRPYGGVCGCCGATRTDRQIGLESSPDEFVEALVGVFCEVRRVLRDDGTVWLNLGDSYAGSWGAQSRPPGEASTLRRNGGTGPNPKMLSAGQIAAHPKTTRTGSIPSGSPFKPKDLLGIPWLVAFALRADGWWLRSEIVWAKPNPMPESVTDRPTRAHEQVFLLSKSARYFYDADAIREDGKDWSSGGPGTGIMPTHHYGADNGGNEGLAGIAARYKDGTQPAGRNKRSVWEIATQPYPEAHFATFPPKLVEPMVLAGSAEGDTVLDPFCGAGTTGVVALRRERSFIGIDLNPDYCELARQRIRDDGPLFNVESEKTDASGDQMESSEAS